MKLQRSLNSYVKNFYKTQKSALLLTGARQTGKTFAIREFGKSFKSFIEINFIENPEAVKIFSNATKADDILLRLSSIVSKPLVKDETLIFFDEVQMCPEIVTTIKFLVDEGSYRYALSGSLLGVELNELRSVPVGYMGIKEVFPIDFREFILNIGVSENVIDALRNSWEQKIPVDEVIHNRLIELYNLYTVIGGMPAAVVSYLETNNLRNVEQTQVNIINLYKRDIAQYASRDKLKIKEIFDLMPSELNNKNKRFILKRMNEHAKYERYENDFLWLSNAGVAIPVYNVEEPKFPLKLASLRNLFKLFSNDCGLLTAQYAEGIQLKILSGEIDINYGAIYENVVAQELICHGITPYYYNSKKMGEIDFVIYSSGRIIPIEVKSGKDYTRHNALKNIIACKEYDIREGIVLCNGNVAVNDRIVYYPIYMTMFIERGQVDSTIYKVDISALK